MQEEPPTIQSLESAPSEPDHEKELINLQAQLEAIQVGDVNELNNKDRARILDLLKQIESLQEKMKVVKQEKEKYWDKEQFIEWARDEVGVENAEEWLDATLDLSDCSHPRLKSESLTLDLSKLKRFPPNLRILYLRLNGQKFSQDLEFPENFHGSIETIDLTDADGFNFPNRIEINLVLQSLTLAEGVNFPDYIGKTLIFPNLTNPRGLKLPNYIGNHLIFNDLKTIKGLVLPDYVGGTIIFDCLSEKRKEKLKKMYPQHADKIE
ncbi:hypothetical protein HN958_00360 [Candidatus Falkowbacteria bacterium]|jgi:hypothetical protein|nr:hypothetical protein [Candidatus Falkowbacteria bacterium]MBT7006941.1 hypothetical protein [Candidatus Falkowbacteria bacterium]